ncbi:MAG: hypothetical protein KDC35_00750 [Acidobacteria bacterium]|nr:hypothetical protein [Acidobacteriota bacterium]
MFLFWVLAFGSLSTQTTLDKSLSDFDVFETRTAGSFEDGTLVVAGRIQLIYLNPDGSLKQLIGSQGQGPGEFQRIHRLTFDGDLIVVSDHGNRRLSIWNSEGELQREMQFPADMVFEFSMSGETLYGLKDLAGHFEGRPSLVRYGSPVTTIWEKKLPGTMPLTSASLEGGREIAMLVSWDPRLAYALGKDFLAVSWPGDGQIHLVDLKTDEVMTSFGCSLPRYPITDDDVDRQVESFDSEYRSALARGLHRAEFWPALSALVVDDQQRIWAFSHRRTQEEPYTSTMFDAKGHVMGTIKVPGVPIQIRKDSCVITIERDDEIWLQKLVFRLES